MIEANAGELLAALLRAQWRTLECVCLVPHGCAARPCALQPIAPGTGPPRGATGAGAPAFASAQQAYDAAVGEWRRRARAALAELPAALQSVAEHDGVVLDVIYRLQGYGSEAATFDLPDGPELARATSGALREEAARQRRLARGHRGGTGLQRARLVLAVRLVAAAAAVDGLDVAEPAEPIAGPSARPRVRQGVNGRRIARRGVDGRRIARQGVDGRRIARQGVDGRQIVRRGVDGRQIARQDVDGRQTARRGVNGRQIARQAVRVAVPLVCGVAGAASGLASWGAALATRSAPGSRGRKAVRAWAFAAATSAVLGAASGRAPGAPARPAAVRAAWRWYRFGANLTNGSTLLGLLVALGTPGGWRPPALTWLPGHAMWVSHDLGGRNPAALGGGTTFGSVFVSRNASGIDDWLMVNHESRHADQFAILGAAMLAYFPLHALWPRERHPFERAAGAWDGGYSTARGRRPMPHGRPGNPALAVSVWPAR